MMMSYEYTKGKSSKIECEVLQLTDNAALLDVDGNDVWIPFSQVEDNGKNLNIGDTGMVYITEWIAEKKGLL
jgi:ribosomal protein S1